MKKLIQFTFSTLFIAASTSLFSQSTLISQWGYTYGNSCAVNSNCIDIKTDHTGNHLTTGTIYGSSGIYAVDLDPSPTSSFPTSVNFANDFYVSKYDPAGNFISAFIIGGPGTDVCNSIAVDNGNNIVVTGFFNGTVDFDPSAGTSTVSSLGSDDMFLAKYTNAGVLLWVKSFGSTLSDKGVKVVTDNQDNIFLTANFSGTMDIDPSSSTQNLVSNGSTDVCLAKFSSSGNLIAGVSFGAASADDNIAITLDQGKHVFISGNFDGSVDFDPSPSTTSIISNPSGSPDVYVSKFDSLLVFQWAKTIQNNNVVQAKYISIDNGGNILLCGFYDLTTVDLDLSPTSTATFSAASGKSAFMAKYDNNGNYLWAGTFGNSDLYSNIASNIWSDNSGNIYSTGTFGSAVDFDLSPATTATYVLTNPSGGPALYFSKYDNAGNFISANVLSSGYIYPAASHMTAGGDLLFCGNMNNPVMLYQNTYLPFDNQCGNYYNAFIAKFTNCVLPSLASVTSSSNTVCAGTSSVVLSVTGSTLNDAANWTWSQNGCTGTPVGTGTSIVVTPTSNTVYYVKGTGGCAGNNLSCSSISISTLPQPTLSLASSAVSVCPNQSFTLTAGGSSTYSWNTGSNTSSIVANASVTTIFSASTTGTNGCVGTKTIAQNVAAVQPIVRTAIVPFNSPTTDPIDSLCAGSNVNIRHSNGSFNYTCNCSYTSNGNLFIIFSNLQTNTVYALSSTDPITGCDNSETFTITVLACTGINDLEELKPTILFPNPTQDFLTIDDETGDFTKVILTNLTGLVVKEYAFDGRKEIDLRNISSGAYIVSIYNNSKRIGSKKIIKE